MKKQLCTSKSVLLILKVNFFLGLFFIISHKTFSQDLSNSVIINPSTNQVSNWSNRIKFNKAYGYDFDLQKATTSAYDCDCLVVVELNESGTGRLVTSLGGNDKSILDVVYAYKSADQIVITAKNPYGATIKAYFSIQGTNWVKQFWVTNPLNNVAAVFQK